MYMYVQEAGYGCEWVWGRDGGAGGYRYEWSHARVSVCMAE